MIGAVVLAAGTSRRYGFGPKQLAALAARPLIAHVLDALAQYPFRPVVVVTGAAAPRVRRAARHHAPGDRALRIAHNAGHGQGMAGSLQLGLGALPVACHAALICLADMPAINTQLLRRLCAAWHPDLDYVRPVHRGRPGHPVLISRRLFGAIDKLNGEQGARTVFARIPAERRRLIETDASCIVDIDTPKALRAWQAHSGRKGGLYT